VLAEFGPDLEIVMANAAGRTERARLDALLPRPFRR
jgi:cytidine deaminase